MVSLLVIAEVAVHHRHGVHGGSVAVHLRTTRLTPGTLELRGEDQHVVVQEHARRGGFPANLVVSVANEFGPQSASV